MSNLEKKLDILMQVVLAEDEDQRRKARAELRQIAKEAAVPVADDPEPVIREIMTDLGMPEHIKGHRFTVKAVMLALGKPEIIDAITKELYPEVGDAFGTTASRVERAIRHAVEVTWGRGDYDTLVRYFGNTISISKGKPTNSEFITRIANIVQMRMKEAA